MTCSNAVCRECPRKIYSAAVAYSVDDTRLTIVIPAGSYDTGKKYCLIVTQAIPATATLFAPVTVQIGLADPTQYAVVTCDGAPLLAQNLRTRTRYPVKFYADGDDGGTVRILGKICCAPVVERNVVSG